MPLPRNPNAYNDVRKVLDTALSKGGVTRFRTKSSAAATRWRLRAYTYRRILLDEAQKAAGDIPGFTPTTPYDEMLLRLDGADVIIQMEAPIEGELVDDKGRKLEILDLDPVTVDKDDPLLLEAQKLAGLVKDE